VHPLLGGAEGREDGYLKKKSGPEVRSREKKAKTVKVPKAQSKRGEQ